MNAAAEAQLKSTAIRELRAIMVRLAKGETAMRIEIWKQNKICGWMEEAEMLRARLEVEMVTGQKSGAIKHMQRIMAGMMRGEAGQCYSK